MAVVRALTLLDDGSLIGAGHQIVGVGNFYLKKVLSTGQVDSTFGVDGIVVDDAGKDAMALAIQSDGKILATGYDWSYNSIVSRYNSDGSHDTTFGNNGAIHLAEAGWSGSVIKDLQILPNDQILLALHGIYSGHVGVAKLNADGSLDQTFAANGTYSLQSNSPYDWSFVRTQSDGKIILCSTTSSGEGWDLFTIRLNENGELDTTYGDAGYSYLPCAGTQHARSLNIDENNNIYIAGSTQPAEITPDLIVYNVDVPRDFFVTKINSNGELDSTFGNGSGAVSFDFGGADTCQAASIQADGKIVMAGMSIINGVDYLALLRLDSNGNVDTNFGNNGKVLVEGLDLNAIWFEVTDVETNSDGKIFAAFTTGSSSFSLAFNNDGSISRGYLLGTEVADSFAGTLSSDILFGYSGDDVLNGGNGDDLISGGTGNDTIIGGSGSDTADFSDSTSGVVVNLSSSTVNGVTANSSTGDGNDTLSGIENAVGGSGNDTLIANNATGSELEGGNGSDLLIGGSAADVLYGGDGNDTVNAGAGNDLIVGGDGAGNDNYNGGDGIDTVKYTSALAGIVVNLNAGFATTKVTSTYSTLSTANPTSLDTSHIGNDKLASIENIIAGNYNDALIGNTNANRLDGGIGADTMSGGTGNDTYVVDNTGDVVTENSNAGIDTVITSINFTLGNNVENLVLAGNENLNGTGNSSANSITGNSGNNNLNGGVGADSMFGGAGNDTYLVDNLSDKVYETATSSLSDQIDLGGMDTIQSSVSFTLGSFIENLTLTGTSSINATGNGLANTLTGNSGANLLNGGAGSDTMLGGAGNDTYIVDDAGDIVTENSNAGIDLIQSSISYTLGSNVENLTLTGTSSINATGNGLANTLTGNSGANILDGGAGNDVMIGGAGNDTYYVDSAGDKVTESANAGTDTIITSTANYSLSAILNLENLTYSGISNATLTGNSLNNILTGSTGNDIMDGGSGLDSLIGGYGNDILNGGLGNDLLTGGDGADHFVFKAALNSTSNIDTITDFVSGTDKIDLSKSVMSGLGAIGDLSEAQFYAASGATSGHDSSDRIIYNSTSGSLYYDADGSGSKAAILIAIIGTIPIHPELLWSDFSIIA